MKIIPSKDVPPPDPHAAQGLLGPFLPEPPALVLISGETSAGKTVFTNNAAYHIAEGKKFVGLTPTAALRVLYLDLESPEQVHRRLVQAIGGSDNLAFVRSMPSLLSSTAGQEDLKRAIQEWDARAVVIDPLPVAWPVRDENDNAEADRQMWRLKEIAVETGTLILVLWNMGETWQVKARFRARGATARVDRTDQALNYTEIAPTARKLEVVKSRYGHLGESITVQFAEDFGFKAVAGVDVSPPQMQLIEAHIVTLVTERPYSRQELLTALKEKGFTNANLIDKALGDLCAQGKLRRTGRGMYALPESSDSQ